MIFRKFMKVWSLVNDQITKTDSYCFTTSDGPSCEAKLHPPVRPTSRHQNAKTTRCPRDLSWTAASGLFNCSMFYCMKNSRIISFRTKNRKSPKIPRSYENLILSDCHLKRKRFAFWTRIKQSNMLEIPTYELWDRFKLQSQASMPSKYWHYQAAHKMWWFPSFVDCFLKLLDGIQKQTAVQLVFCPSFVYVW